jgi:hypothetical protein|tara:strand:- start:263 stop:421 length:159 start_codon:yes stop_codon:yes gene_type:complete
MSNINVGDLVKLAMDDEVGIIIHVDNLTEPPFLKVLVGTEITYTTEDDIDKL